MRKTEQTSLEQIIERTKTGFLNWDYLRYQLMGKTTPLSMQELAKSGIGQREPSAVLNAIRSRVVK